MVLESEFPFIQGHFALPWSLEEGCNQLVCDPNWFAGFCLSINDVSCDHKGTKNTSSDTTLPHTLQFRCNNSRVFLYIKWIHQCIRSKAVLSNNFLENVSFLSWESYFIIVLIWLLIPSKPTIALLIYPKIDLYPKIDIVVLHVWKYVHFNTHIFMYIYIYIYTCIFKYIIQLHVRTHIYKYIQYRYCKWVTYHPSSPP